jgi:glycosyltransferase involved in cell wall biosynthesis
MGSFCIDGRYIQDHFPGIGRYTYNLIDALARVAPHEQFVVLHNPALKNTRYAIAALARHPNVELRRADVPTFSLAEQYHLSFALRRSAFALFHSPYYVKPYWVPVPSVVTLFDLIPLRAPDRSLARRARFLFRLAVSLAARTSARIITPSAATKEDLSSVLGVPRDKTQVIPLAADARFAPQTESEKARVREHYDLPREYVLSVGINKPHKNIPALLDAWQSLGETQRTLVIAGAWDARYASVASRQSSAARFIPNVDDRDLPALYAGAAVFVFPSLYEGFGLPPLEAMACGAPVVCSNAASLPEVVGDAALLVSPRDVSAIADAIQRVLTDAALREELRAKSLARAAQFSWERTARETLNVYKQFANVPVS